MEEVKVFYQADTDTDTTPIPRAGFLCGGLCYSGFLCPGGGGCN